MKKYVVAIDFKAGKGIGGFGFVELLAKNEKSAMLEAPAVAIAYTNAGFFGADTKKNDIYCLRLVCKTSKKGEWMDIGLRFHEYWTRDYANTPWEGLEESGKS